MCRTERRTIQLAPPGHPAIDLRWLRDVTYDEDHSRVRAGNSPRIMTSLRYNGWTNIAKGRHMARNPTRPLTLLGIPT